MEAKFILLTHFSQRYAKIPIFGPQMHQNVGVAFDNMCVSPSQLHLLPCMIPILKLMFAEHYQEMEERGQKRQIREEKLKQLQDI
jgi:ribonuclease Z